MTLLDRERLVTRTGLRLEVRAARGEDERALAAFFAKVTPEDMRFRFLSTLGAPGHDQLLALIEKPSANGESLIAWGEDGTIAATAVLAGDAAGERAEAAILLRGDLKGRGSAGPCWNGWWPRRGPAAMRWWNRWRTAPTTPPCRSRTTWVSTSPRSRTTPPWSGSASGCADRRRRPFRRRSPWARRRPNFRKATAMMTAIFVFIKCELGYANDVAADIVDNVENVSEVYSTSGQHDLLAKFNLPREADIGTFVTKQVQTRPHVRDTFTVITFSPFLPSKV